MKLLEIKNNLVKLSYEQTETPVLGRFIVLGSDKRSYVAQFVNLKSEETNNYAIAKLLFTVTPDGVVDNYDGSIPGLDFELTFLSSDELLDLLPIETPIKIANLAQQDNMLNLDISVFEHNLTVFASREIDKTTFISNCVRQLFQMKEKSVIIDTFNQFEDYPKIVFTKDFKLPLNSALIDYIFENELNEVDAATKAVIQDIFYAVQEYIKTLDYEFLPIDNFVDVVEKQYKETQMPELALLKNKLLKYRDANVFANKPDEVFALAKKLNEKNCCIIDLKPINETLQKEVISFVHNELEKLQKYVYLFVPLTDDNSDKKLLKQIINNNHVFTTILTSHSYKYAQELKEHAQNIILFAPQTQQHDYADYNTFLGKLNLGECVVYGKLTQGVPFIVDMTDLELDLTKDDVLGDRFQFVPVNENVTMVQQPDSLPPEVEPEVQAPQPVVNIPQIENSPLEISEDIKQTELETVQKSVATGIVQAVEEFQVPDETVETNDVASEIPESVSSVEINTNVIEPVADILEDNVEQDLPNFDDNLDSVDFSDEQEDISIEEQQELTEDDLNFIEDTQVIPSQAQESQDDDIEEDSYVESPYDDEQTPVVPVYSPELNTVYPSDGTEFAQGDSISHPRYGRGVIEKIIKYGNKTLCSISFENVGRRLLDPSISEFVKL